MLLWNQVALWRHAAGARTITGYPFGPTNLPVNAFGPWPGGTSWTPPAETACVWPWLGRHSVIRSRGRGVGPPLHEATLPLRQQRTGVIARERTSSAHAGRLPGTPPCLNTTPQSCSAHFNPPGPWAHARGGQCPRGCRTGFLNATKGEFWFVHKPTSLLLGSYATWYRCPRANAGPTPSAVLEPSSSRATQSRTTVDATEAQTHSSTN